MIPPPLREAIEARLGAVRGVAGVGGGGGSIHQAVRIETTAGVFFLKYNPQAPPGMFATEARGLDALRSAAAGLVVPRVVAAEESSADGAPAWLALEWLDGVRSVDHDERLGRGLAALHRAGGGKGWGWQEDNWLGTLPQSNRPTPSWADFWRERRLMPQLDLARQLGRFPGREAEWDRLLDELPDRLKAGEEDGPSLLHGDLWSGNVVASSGGPALVDPAVYRGHREVDLAMAALFGGFGERFFRAYDEAWPPRAGSGSRRAIYQLYPLLAHVNLFGGGYGVRTAATLRAALAS